MIEGKKTSLRGLEQSDSYEMLLYWNRKEFLDFSGRTSPLTEGELVTWIQETWKERKEGKCYTFGIALNENSLLIGYINLRIINRISRRGKLSIGIFNPQYRNIGLGTEALNLLVEYSFSTLNLLSLELNVFTNNPRAIACYSKIGFKEVGIRRKADFVNGKFLDDLVMDLIVEEWRK
jgi:RimJ/RimL family protein N-acetyltransferase